MKPVIISASLLVLLLVCLVGLTLAVTVNGKKAEPTIETMELEDVKTLFGKANTYRLNDIETLRLLAQNGIQLAVNEAAYLYMIQKDEKEFEWFTGNVLRSVEIDTIWMTPQDSVDYINIAQNRFGSPAKDFEASTIANVFGIKMWSIVAQKPGAASFRLQNDDLSQKIFVGIEVLNTRN